MDNLLLTPVPLEKIFEGFRSIIKEEVKALATEELQEKFLSPEEVTKMFQPNISIGTVGNWAKEGLIKKHFIGGKTWYKYSEIIDSVKHLHRYKTKVPTAANC